MWKCLLAVQRFDAGADDDAEPGAAAIDGWREYGEIKQVVGFGMGFSYCCSQLGRLSAFAPYGTVLDRRSCGIEVLSL